MASDRREPYRARASGVRALGLAACVLAACAQVPAPVAGSDVAVGAPGWRAAFARGVGSPIVSGNRVEILADGPVFFPAMLTTIRGARTSITYAQFIYKESEMGRVLTEALAERCRAGVAVHVLIDAWGARYMPGAYADRLREAGCQAVDDYRPLRLSNLARLNFRHHRRILVVDGRVAFTGGSGVGPVWMGEEPAEGLFRDTDVRLEGPIVRDLQRAFGAMWQEATGAVLDGRTYYPSLDPAGDVEAQVVASAPIRGDFSVRTALLLAISAARRSIHVTNQYLVLDDSMREALVDAARRGVDVVIIVPGVPTNQLVFAAGWAEYGRLLRAGIEIYAYAAGPLHAKTMVVDGQWATVGSTNLDTRSLAINDELNVVLYDVGVAGTLDDLFAADLARSRRVTLRHWLDRGFRLRLFGLLAWPFRGQL